MRSSRRFAPQDDKHHVIASEARQSATIVVSNKNRYICRLVFLSASLFRINVKPFRLDWDGQNNGRRCYVRNLLQGQRTDDGFPVGN